MAMQGEWPDKESIRYLWGKIVKLVDKKFGEIKIPDIPDPTIKTDSTLMDRNGLLSVSFPNRELTKEQYDALSEEERNSQMLYVVTDEEPEPAPSTGGGVPSGCVLAWYGTKETIPDGWAICDGTNGTPNLVGRFIYGGTAPGATGGEATHTLTPYEMPSHSHDLHMPSSGASQYKNMSLNNIQFTTNVKAGSYTGAISTAGGNQPHNNMPPYYTLTYIMKL